MRHPYLCLGGLVGVAVFVGPLQAARAQGQAVVAAAHAASGGDRPPAYTLRLTERQVLARFIPEVRTRADLRDRAVVLWRSHFAAEADAIRLRFTQEDDWRPAFADAAALVDDFLEASMLPRAGEFPAGEGGVWVESIDPRSGHRVRARQQPRRRPVLLAPKDGAKLEAKIEGKDGKDDGDKSGITLPGYLREKPRTVKPVRR